MTCKEDDHRGRLIGGIILIAVIILVMMIRKGRKPYEYDFGGECHYVEYHHPQDVNPADHYDHHP